MTTCAKYSWFTVGNSLPDLRFILGNLCAPDATGGWTSSGTHERWSWTYRIATSGIHVKIMHPRHMKVHSFMAFSEWLDCHLGKLQIGRNQKGKQWTRFGKKKQSYGMVVIVAGGVLFLMHPKYSVLNSISSPLAMTVDRLLYWVSRFCKSASKAVTDLKVRWRWRVH